MTVVRRTMIVLAMLSFAAIALGSAMLLMLTPAYTHTLVLWADAPERSGLSAAETLYHAERVRAYVAGDADIELAERLHDGRPAFDARAVSHLADVRVVLARARMFTGIAAAFVVGWLVWALAGAGSKVHALAVSLTGAAWLIVGIIIVSAAFALLDFGRFFTVFHSLFFEADTWVFPPDAFLIRLFPAEFWMASGGVWAALSLMAAILMAAGARVAGAHSSAMEE